MNRSFCSDRAARARAGVGGSVRRRGRYVHLLDEGGTRGAIEVDFLLRQGKRPIAIEAKAGRRFRPEMVKGLSAIDGLGGVKRRILVYGGKDSWTTDESVEVMSPARFIAEVSRGL